MGDARIKILEEACQVLEEQGDSPIAREYLLKLLDILATSLEKYSLETYRDGRGSGAAADRTPWLVVDAQTTNRRTGCAQEIKHQPHLQPRPARCAGCGRDRGHAPDRQTRGMSTFSSTRIKNFPLARRWMRTAPATNSWSKPRSNGLTYTVARNGETIIVEDMQRSSPLSEYHRRLGGLDHRHSAQSGRHGGGRDESLTLHNRGFSPPNCACLACFPTRRRLPSRTPACTR